MNCGAAFIFDRESEAAMREVWRVVARAGGSNTMLGLDYPPHLTLLMAERLDFERTRGGFMHLAAATRPLEIALSGLGIFPGQSGVLYLAPVVTRELLDLHACYYSLVSQYADPPTEYYRTETWVPHITVGYGLTPEAIGAAVQALMSVQLPKKACIAGLTMGCFNIGGQSDLAQVHFDEE